MHNNYSRRRYEGCPNFGNFPIEIKKSFREFSIFKIWTQDFKILLFRVWIFSSGSRMSISCQFHNNRIKNTFPWVCIIKLLTQDLQTLTKPSFFYNMLFNRRRAVKPMLNQNSLRCLFVKDISSIKVTILIRYVDINLPTKRVDFIKSLFQR